MTPSGETHAKIDAPGIADAMPPIYAGDLVLLRPLRNIAWVKPSRRRPNGRRPKPHKANGKYEWTERIFALEIQSQVTNVRRAYPDKIDFSWVQPPTKDELVTTYPEQQYNVRVVPSTIYHERCLTALQWISTLPANIVNQLLFPDEAPAVPHDGGDEGDEESLIRRLGDLNSKQEMFVRLVRARTIQQSVDIIRSPIILTGPAGTGKTRTMLSGIFEVLQLSGENRILVCTPSHIAADIVTQRLSEKLNKNQLWRLVDALRPIETLPSAILPFCRQDIETGAFMLPTNVADIYSYRVIVCTCSDAHILYKMGFTNQQLRMRRECFANYSREVSERLHLDPGNVASNAAFPHFTHLFVDEAAQATEPEIMISLSVVVDPAPGSVKAEIGLVGDPRQLSPNIFSKQAADSGLGKSYMERMLQRPMNYQSGGWPYMLGPDGGDDIPFDMQHKRSCIFLTVNYRGHASFLMMPSSLFYYDKLESIEKQDTPVWASKLRNVEALSKPASGLAILWDTICGILPTNAWTCADLTAIQVRRKENWPVHFRGVVGQDRSVTIETFAGSSSFSNHAEAVAVVEIVSTLVADKVSTSAIGVMSPFRGQVVLIRQMLRTKGLNGVDVGTVENYQAAERDVIVLSLTRSSEKFISHDAADRTGVFQQPKRTNVALTRAGHLFIVVGNPNLMIKDSIWKQWLWFCLRNGLWYGETIDESLLEEMQGKPLTVAAFRQGERHSLLGDVDDQGNTVLLSSLEKGMRTP